MAICVKKVHVILFSLALLETMILIAPMFTASSAYAAQSTGNLTVASVATDESEANDEFESANRFKMNQVVYGTLASTDDVDYYKVDVAKASAVKFTYTNDKYKDTSNGFSFVFYNKYFEPISGDVTNNDDHDYFKYTRPITYTLNLPKGTCYLVVTDDQNESSLSGHPYHFVMKYVVNKTTVTKVSKKAKGFTVRWVKKAGATKYQVRYATAKNMSKAKTINCSNKSASKTISKLKSGKKYWVQVRVLKKINGETYYSDWSGKKAVVTK